MSLFIKNFGVDKFDRKIMSAILFAIVAIFAFTSIYAIANYFGIHLATKSYQKMVTLIGQGASVGSAWYAVAGVAAPEFLLSAVAVFGTASA